jgi:hypothetical protein
MCYDPKYTIGTREENCIYAFVMSIFSWLIKSPTTKYSDSKKQCCIMCYMSIILNIIFLNNGSLISKLTCFWKFIYTELPIYFL